MTYKEKLDNARKILFDLVEQFKNETNEEEKTKLAFRSIIPDMNYRSAIVRYAMFGDKEIEE